MKKGLKFVKEDAEFENQQGSVEFEKPIIL